MQYYLRVIKCKLSENMRFCDGNKPQTSEENDMQAGCNRSAVIGREMKLKKIVSTASLVFIPKHPFAQQYKMK